jgi:hypothetical protein
MRSERLFVAIMGMVFANGLAQAQRAAPPAPAQPRTYMEWFARASDQMNIRAVGSSPFHLMVAFHAFPGEELLGSKEKPQIVTGDGTYQEIWLAPHLWRREVALGHYHAVEVESPEGRKMQASSDYVPSRVLMLMGALLHPIPQNLLAAELQSAQKSRWAIARLSQGDLSLVRIADTHTYAARFTVHAGYYFLPEGLLVMRNEAGLTFAWEKDELFSGKVVPRHIGIQADGLKANAPNRNLLTADVRIEPQGKADASLFNLPGPPSDPGSTLRPLRGIAKPPQPKDDPPSWSGNHDAAFVLWGVVDRTGAYRELEVTSTSGASGLAQYMDAIRRSRSQPAEIDGYPCEVSAPQIVTREWQLNTR